MGATGSRRASGKRASIDLSDDRYARLRLMPWWDQERVSGAKVVVGGAGALGNEIIKNLALLGIGEMLIIDFDQVEQSNLSRSVLFREADGGLPKARAAATAAAQINPECRVFALSADVVRQVGAGVFRWADVAICGLDSREARLAVNRACWKTNTPWVDGATEAFQGVVRAFVPPDGVCYECTLGEQDQKLLSVRNSCGFLASDALRRGLAPTTPTTSAVIAGIQVQEALKLLHAQADLGGLAGKGFFFDGVTYDCFVIDYARRDDCISHESFGSVMETNLASERSSLTDVIDLAQERLGGDPIIDLPGEMITELRCSACGSQDAFFRLLDSTGEDLAKCPRCGQLRVPDTVTECDRRSPFAGMTLSDLGFPVLEILTARADERKVHVEVSRDADRVFAWARTVSS